MNKRRKNYKFTAIDLFSGCGGMTLGLKKAGFHVLGAIDIDPLSVETYKLNHKKVNVWQQDIRTVSIDEVHRQLGLKKGMLDLLAGCPPCQGFSTVRTLNKGRAVRDPRNDLVFEFLRFVKGLEPRTVMMENVPGLMNDKRLFILQSQLEGLGYKTRVEVLDAANYGVPQRRRRLILVGGLRCEVPPAHTARKQRTVHDTIADLPKPGRTNDPCHDLKESRSGKILSLIQRIPKDGGSRRALGPRGQLECHKHCDGFKDIYGRMAWNKVAPTITGGCINPSKGRFLHPEQNRAITLREAALLQTFPKKYRFSLRRGKHHAAVLIGNALPPEFIRRHATTIAKHLSDF